MKGRDSFIRFDRICLRHVILSVLMAVVMTFAAAGTVRAEGMAWSVSDSFRITKVVYDADGGAVTVDVEGNENGTEYEMYVMKKGEIADSMGTYTLDGETYSIVGISTIPGDDKESVSDLGGGKATIKTTMYWGDALTPSAGDEVFIGLEALDKDYNPVDQSNLVGLTVPSSGEETVELESEAETAEPSDENGSEDVQEDAAADDVSSENESVKEDSSDDGSDDETLSDNKDESKDDTVTASDESGEKDESDKGESEKNYLPFILAGIGLLVGIGIIFFVFVSNKDDEDEENKKK